MKKFITLLFVCTMFFVSCSKDESNPIAPIVDNEAPDAITDLSIAFTSGDMATLYLTATGDDGMVGRARTYEVRYSTNIIDSANYFQAQHYTAPDQPNVGTAADTIVVPNLFALTTYYFAVKIADEAGNWSPISNIDSATTLHGGTWRIYNTDNSDIPLDNITDVQFDGAIKYIATTGGVSTFDNINWDMIYESRSISHIDTTIVFLDTTFIATDTTIDTTYISTPNYVNSIAIESVNKIWFGTNNSGVSLFEGDSLVFYSSNDSGLLTSTRDILISQNKLWVGTSNNGLHSFTLDGSDVWEKFTVPINLPGTGRINCLVADDNNVIWSGLQISGATVLENLQFTNYSNANGFINGQVLEVVTSGTKVLFGTDAGAYLFENNGWLNYTTTDGLPDNSVLAIAVDAQGKYWFGTRDGLASYDGFTWEVYNTSNSYLPNNYINVLRFDMFGNLWIGTQNGLAKLTN